MPDSFSKDVEPLFLAYGKACYVAQSLETTLRTLLSLHRAHSGVPVAEAFSDIESETVRKAANDLFEAARKAAHFSAGEVEQIKAAMKTRNVLMHHFWRKSMPLASTQSGRQQILHDLAASSATIWSANTILVREIDHFFAEFGMDTELCKQLATELHESGDLAHKLLH